MNDATDTCVGQTAVGIDVDCFTQYLYWTDVSGKAISRAKLDGTDSDVLIQSTKNDCRIGVIRCIFVIRFSCVL